MALTRATWALDEDERKALRERAVRHSLYADDPKAFRAAKLPALKSFPEFQKSYLKAAQSLDNTGKSDTILLLDITIFRSIGAKANNYDIMDLETGEMFHFVEGTKLVNVEVFAGKGSRSVYVKAYKYADRYGGKVEDWQHVKGVGWVSTDDGDRRAEVHWSQCEGIGKHDFFLKRWLD